MFILLEQGTNIIYNPVSLSVELSSIRLHCTQAGAELGLHCDVTDKRRELIVSR